MFKLVGRTIGPAQYYDLQYIPSLRGFGASEECGDLDPIIQLKVLSKGDAEAFHRV